MRSWCRAILWKFSTDMKNNSRNINGQAMAENLLLIPLLIIVIMMLFWFARMVITRQQLLSAARLGTDLILYSGLNQDQIRQEIRDYLCGNDVEGRKLDSSKFSDDKIIINNRSYGKITTFSANAYKIPNYDTSTVDIYYDLNVPPLVNVWGKWFGGSWGKQSFRIRAHSEVIAGTGCNGDSYQ